MKRWSSLRNNSLRLAVPVVLVTAVASTCGGGAPPPAQDDSKPLAERTRPPVILPHQAAVPSHQAAVPSHQAAVLPLDPASAEKTPYMTALDLLDDASSETASERRREAARAALEALARSNAPPAYIHYHQARAYALLGETEAALAALETVSRTPLAVAERARAEMRALLLADGRTDEVWRRLTAEERNDPRTRIALAEVELHHQNPSRAAEHLVAAARSAKGGREAVSARAEAAARFVALAAQDTRVALDAFPPKTLVELGEAAYRGGRSEEAVRLYRAAIARLAPGDPLRRKAELGEVYALVRSDRYGEAVEALRRISPRGTAAWRGGTAAWWGGDDGDFIEYSIGTNLERLGRDREAYGVYSTFLSRYRRSRYRDDVLWRRALLRERLYGPEAGVAAMKRLLREHPRSEWAPAAAWRIGTIRFLQNDPEGAAEAFEAAVERFPESDYAPGMKYWIARTYEARGELSPPHAPLARAAYLEVLFDGRSPYYMELASQALRRLLSPKDVEELRAEAEALLSAGDTAGALARLRAVRWITGEPKDPRTEILVASLPDWNRLAASAERLTDPRGFADPPGGYAALLPEKVGAAERFEAAIELAEAGSSKEAAEEIVNPGGEKEEDLRPEAHLALAYVHALAGRPLPSIRYAERATRACTPALTPGEMPPLVARLLYPPYYRPLILAAARARNLDPYLVAAQIREESRFEAAIASWAGAQGLMQLMPATASRAAKEVGLDPTNLDLTDPTSSIALGTHYLAKMRDRFDGRMYLALAAYNAGPANAERWIRQSGEAPMDLFVERITFQETRGYVKRVLGSAAAYREVYGTRDGDLPRRASETASGLRR